MTASPTLHSLQEKDADLIAGRQKLRFFPSSICSGDGCEVRDEHGRSYLDLSASWGAHGVGYANPRVVRAVSEAVERSAAASVLSAMNPDAVALAERLLGIVPNPSGGARRVLFGHSGTDANNAAIDAARAHSGRPLIVAFEGGYHGGFGEAKQASGVFVGSQPGPGAVLLTYPVAGSAGERGAPTMAQVFERLDSVLASGDVAAVLVESQQSDGGVLVPPAGFLAGLAARARAAGALLICDEVKVGLGRTGSMHGFDHDGVAPDMVTFGKSLGGGLPLSAVVGPAEVLDLAPASALLTTAGGSIATASGLAVLDEIVDGRLAQNAEAMGREFFELLQATMAGGGAGSAIREVRGRGLSIGIEVFDPEAPADADRASRFARRVVYRLWQLGAICYLVRDNVLELTPPLIIDAARVRRAVELIEQALGDVLLGAVGDEDIAPYQGW